jgi:hypothetical protein
MQIELVDIWMRWINHLWLHFVHLKCQPIQFAWK